jgi:hypothetical protein
MIKNFGKISDILPEDPETWESRFFLTFDIDWANDIVLSDSIDLVEKADISATWFVTHDTPLLNRLRANPKFELGIHPNFNFLLNGDSRNGSNAEEVIDRLLYVVPEAKSVRSHSMTQSSHLLQLFVDRGLYHDCNHYIPRNSRIKLAPWRYWLKGAIKVPYFWEDDLACYDQMKTPFQDFLHTPGLRVFDFHPIHVFLNTDNLEQYYAAKSFITKTQELLKFRSNNDDGSRTSLLQLIGS